MSLLRSDGLSRTKGDQLSRTRSVELVRSRSVELSRKLKAHVHAEGATRSLAVRAYHRGQLKIDLKLGEQFKFYDLASITKIAFTVTALMKAFDQKLFSLEDKLNFYLPWTGLNIPLRKFLTHSAGLTWWKPFYQDIDLNLWPSYRWHQLSVLLEEEIKKERSQGKKAVYSDLDFFLLGYVLEALFEEPLLEVWRSLQREMKLKEMDFLPMHFPPVQVFLPLQVKDVKGSLFGPNFAKDRELFAPTEICSWRGRKIQAEVHDQNAWALGGVAPHAGLFASMDGFSQFFLSLRARYVGDRESSFPVSQKTLHQFTSRALPRSQGDWGLGFMLPGETGSSSGSYFSKKSFGHLGFTGTSVWYDPKVDLLALVLSNRTYPSHENVKMRMLRPLIHDEIYQLCMKEIS